VAGVAGCAEATAAALVFEPELLVSAAWLHDVGYGPGLVSTGFHALDGARFLRLQGVDERVVNLVAHHSHSLLEAREHGLDGHLLAEFPFDHALPHDALCYCDMTTGPDGQRMAVHERLAEIRERYGPGDVVARFIASAEPGIVATVRRVEERLAAAQSR
jgi:hypothetical protein